MPISPTNATPLQNLKNELKHSIERAQEYLSKLSSHQGDLFVGLIYEKLAQQIEAALITQKNINDTFQPGQAISDAAFEETVSRIEEHEESFEASLNAAPIKRTADVFFSSSHAAWKKEVFRSNLQKSEKIKKFNEMVLKCLNEHFVINDNRQPAEMKVASSERSNFLGLLVQHIKYLDEAVSLKLQDMLNVQPAELLKDFLCQSKILYRQQKVALVTAIDQYADVAAKKDLAKFTLTQSTRTVWQSFVDAFRFWARKEPVFNRAELIKLLRAVGDNNLVIERVLKNPINRKELLRAAQVGETNEEICSLSLTVRRELLRQAKQSEIKNRAIHIEQNANQIMNESFVESAADAASTTTKYGPLLRGPALVVQFSAIQEGVAPAVNPHIP